MLDRLKKILDKMDDITYGFTDINGNSYEANNDNYKEVFPTKYHLKINDTLLEKKYGVCWDQVELERYYLEKEDVDCTSYGIICYDDDMDPTHTFLVIKDGNKYYWLEKAWEKYEGLREYNSLRDLLLDVKKEFILMLREQNIFSDNIFMYRYDKPLKEYDCIEFYKYLESGKLIKLNEENNYFCLLKDNNGEILDISVSLDDSGYLYFYKKKEMDDKFRQWYKVNINDEELQKLMADVIYGDNDIVKIKFKIDRIPKEYFLKDGDNYER